jgi:predicted dehydrogenase
MIVYDDVDPIEKVKVYDKGVVVSQDPEQLRRLRIEYRTGDIHIPGFDQTEALRTEAQHFLECVRTGQQPLTDGASGTRIVRILEAAAASTRARGKLVELTTPSERAA